MNLSQFQLDYSEMPKFYRTVDEPENEKNSLFSSTSYRERNSLGEKKTLLNNDGSKPTRFLKKE